MPLKTIHILRHGFRANWVSDNWTTPTGLERDPPLAAFGEAQSQEVAEYFSSLPEDERPTILFSSPFYRCMQTIAPTARAMNLPINIEPGLQEWFSPVAPGTGLHPRPAPASELRTFFSEIDAETWKPVYYPPRAGEEVEEVHVRAASTLEGLAIELATSQFAHHERIVLCTHAATAIAFVRALLSEREYPIRIGCCTISTFERAASSSSSGTLGKGAWNAIRLADGSHLKGGAQRDWGFEDIEIKDGKVVLHPGVAGSENDVDEPKGPQYTVNSKM